MINLVKVKGGTGIFARKVSLGDYKYAEHRLFLAMGEQPFYCLECGGGTLDPNDYEDIRDIHVCPFCKNPKQNFGFTYWSSCLTLQTLDIVLNVEVPTVSKMVVLLNQVGKDHGIKFQWHEAENANPK